MIYLLGVLLLLILIISIIANKKDITAPAIIFTFGFAFQCFWAILYHKAWRLNLHLNTFLVLFLGVLEFFLVTMLVKFIANKIKPRKKDDKPFAMQEVKTNKSSANSSRLSKLDEMSKRLAEFNKNKK